jgi:hypothetical protein
VGGLRASQYLHNFSMFYFIEFDPANIRQNNTYQSEQKSETLLELWGLACELRGDDWIGLPMDCELR